MCTMTVYASNILTLAYLKQAPNSPFIVNRMSHQFPSVLRSRSLSLFTVPQAFVFLFYNLPASQTG